jgi:hypothetical protein
MGVAYGILLTANPRGEVTTPSPLDPSDFKKELLGL